MQQVDQPQHRGRPELVCLLAQTATGLVGDRQRVGHLAGVLHEHQRAEVFEQIDHEPSEVLALLGELLQEDERAGRVPFDHEVAEAEENLLLDRAEELKDVLDGDPATCRSRKLVERRDRVAERATCRPRHERERRVGNVHLFAVRNPAQQLQQVRQPRPLEDERLTARAHGQKHLLELRRAEDEEEVGRRLLDKLQERVPGGVGELVRLVEDVDLVLALDGLEHDAVADLANVVDPPLRGRVHLDHVERRPVRDRDACVAGVVGSRRRAVRAVDRFGEDARERRLARAARPGEEVRLADLAGRDRVRKRSHHRFLPDDVLEGLRAVLAVERGHESPTLTRSEPRVARLAGESKVCL